MLCLIRVFILSLDRYEDAFIKHNDCHGNQSPGKMLLQPVLCYMEPICSGGNEQAAQSQLTAPHRKH